LARKLTMLDEKMDDMADLLRNKAPLSNPSAGH